MVREIAENELYGLLQLYLYLHEKSIPEITEHLRRTWNTIIQDENHHIIVNVIDGKIISSCVCVIIPNLDFQLQIGQKLFSHVGRFKLKWRKIAKRIMNTKNIEQMNIIRKF